MTSALRRLGLSLLVGIGGMLFAVSEPGFSLEEQVGLDLLFGARGVRSPPDDAVIVRVDRDAIQRLRGLPDDPEAWPEPLRGCGRRVPGLAALSSVTAPEDLPRGLYACLVGELARRGAGPIVFDILFAESARREVGVAELAVALRRHGRAVLLAGAVRAWLAPAEGMGPAPLQADIVQLPDRRLRAAAAASATFVLPHAASRVNQFWAYSPAVPDPAQLPVRALELASGDALMRFAVQPAAAALGPDAPAPASQALGRLRVPSTAPGPAEPARAQRDRRILEALARVRRGPAYYYASFYGPPGTLPSYSIVDLLIEPAELPAVAGRTVFVGQQELRIAQSADSFPTVFRSELGILMSGVEIAATAYDNLIHDETLRPMPEGIRALIVLAMGTALTFLSCSGGLWRGLALAGAAAVTYALGVTALFIGYRIWLPLVVPVGVLLPVAVLVGQTAHYVGAARWLGIYAPRLLTRRLLSGDERYTTAARTGEATVMITDIVGSTTLFEHLPPETAARLVNEHFTTLTAIIEGEGGTVGDFAGDGLLAFWGAPEPLADHAARACRAALAIAAALEADGQKPSPGGMPPIRVRIGINTGPVSMGNVGSPRRSTYGLVGDTVNATQRIEQLGKRLCPDRPPAAILISARTAAEAGRAFATMDMGRHEVAGRSDPIGVLRLCGGAGTGPSARPAAPAPWVDHAHSTP